ncbi:MAG TPA: phospholipase D-like domain-containing protein [Trebonia sp.]|nr:phospholipase D-like domain-containing protein [Trebonia sp.]
MPRFGMRKFPSALATLAAIVLGVAGCLTAAAVVPARAATDFSLVILPDQGENAIDNFVNSATSSINVTIYELNDTTLVNDLVAREKAGVAVRVILDQAQKSYNTAAYNALTAGGVGVVWSSATFTYTHQKTITVNNDESYISTGNFDTAYYATSRDYGVFDTDASDVAAIVAVFNADYAHTSITPSDGDDLVWSPTDSQTRLLALINGATKSLDIEQEEFSDTAIINALVAAEKRGVTVRVVLEDPSSYSSEVSEVEAAGGQVTGYSSSTGFYIHAKTIIADYGTSAQKAFAGSENFSSNSLNDNRELGLITTDTGVVDGLESTFAGDFSGSAAGKVSIIGPGSLTSPVGSVVDYQVQADDTCTGSLSYAASGLPKGLSISSSTGVISGTPTTAGSAAVTVTATDTTGASGSTSFAFTISAAAGGCGAQQLLVNGGFETGSISPWTASSGVLASNTSAHPSQAGSYLAWLDGYSKTHVDTLSQKVAIPATCVSANFTYWVEVNSTGTTTTEQPENTLVLQILNSSGTVESTTTVATAANSGSSYVEHSASLGSYIGQTITLKFTATEVAGGNTQFLDDSNALTVS